MLFTNVTSQREILEESFEWVLWGQQFCVTSKEGCWSESQLSSLVISLLLFLCLYVFL